MKGNETTSELEIEISHQVSSRYVTATNEE